MMRRVLDSVLVSTLFLHVALNAQVVIHASQASEVVAGAEDFAAFNHRNIGFGDYDGDGAIEYARGVPATSPSAVATLGLVSILRFVPVPPNGRLECQLLRPLASADEDPTFGESVTLDGDLTGDAHPEVIVGAPGLGANPGRVFIYSGATLQLVRTLHGAQPGGRFGHALDASTDFDGDGLPDLAISEPEAVIEGVARGRVLVYSGVTGTLLREYRGALNGTNFGAVLRTWDHHGAPSILIGGLLPDVDGEDGTVVYLYYPLPPPFDQPPNPCSQMPAGCDRQLCLDLEEARGRYAATNHRIAGDAAANDARLERKILQARGRLFADLAAAQDKAANCALGVVLWTALGCLGGPAGALCAAGLSTLACELDLAEDLVAAHRRHDESVTAASSEWEARRAELERQAQEAAARLTRDENAAEERWENCMARVGNPAEP